MYIFTKTFHKRHVRLSGHKRNVIKHEDNLIVTSNSILENNVDLDDETTEDNISFDSDAPFSINFNTGLIFNQCFYDSLQFCNHQSKSFFINELESYGQGVRHLIQKAVTKDNNQATQTHLPNDNITLHKLIAGFSLNLTKNDCTKFAQILEQISICYPSSFTLTSNVPNSYNNLRNMYLRGGLSIKDNLPIPNIYRKGLAAYVMFSDLIKDLICIRITNIEVFNEK